MILGWSAPRPDRDLGVVGQHCLMVQARVRPRLRPGHPRRPPWQGDLRPFPIFSLPITAEVPGVPSEVLHPWNTEKDGPEDYAQAKKLAAKFREHAARFEMSEKVMGVAPIG